jgi:predicted nucleic acid-binding protein
VESREELVTSNYIAVEMAALVQHRLGVAALRALLEDLFGIVRIEWVTVEDHGRAVAALLAASRRKLSLVDCTSFEVMRRLGLRETFALDRHFREAGFDVL